MKAFAVFIVVLIVAFALILWITGREVDGKDDFFSRPDYW